MLLTIAAHFCMPDFRSPHKQFSICYFISLTLSFSLLRIENSVRNHLKVVVCLIFGMFETLEFSCSTQFPNEILSGCISYYAVMCIFFWLLIINYNSWQAIKEYGKLKVNLKKCHLFVWLTAALLLLITISTDFIMKNMDKDRLVEWRPGFTVYSCWINSTICQYLYTVVYLFCATSFLLSVLPSVTSFNKGERFSCPSQGRGKSANTMSCLISRKKWRRVL